MKSYTVELPDELAASLEEEAKLRGITPEACLVQKVYSADSQHVLHGDWAVAPAEEPPQK